MDRTLKAEKGTPTQPWFIPFAVSTKIVESASMRRCQIFSTSWYVPPLSDAQSMLPSPSAREARK